MQLSKKKKKSFRLPERYFLLLIGFQIMLQNRQSILNGLLADLVAIAFKAVHFCPDALFGGETEPYCSDRIFFCAAVRACHACDADGVIVARRD